MADFTNTVLVASSASGVQTLGASNRLVLAAFKVTSTVDFSGATLTGVTATSIANGGGSVDIDGAAALTTTALASVSILTDGTGTLTVKGGGVSQFGDDTGHLAFSGTGAASTSGVTTVDLDASGAVQVNSSGGAISVGNDAVNQAVNIGTGGTRTVTVGSATATLALNSTGGAAVVTVKDNDAAALDIQGSDTTSRLKVVTTNGNEHVALNASLRFASGALAPVVAITAVAGAALSPGDVVGVSGTAGKIFGAEADAATAVLKNPIGIALTGAAGDGSAVAYAIAGVADVTFDATVGTTDIGKLVYLSETAKVATFTPPATAGSTVWLLGILVNCPGGSTTGQVLLGRQYLLTVV